MEKKACFILTLMIIYKKKESQCFELHCELNFINTLA